MCLRITLLEETLKQSSAPIHNLCQTSLWKERLSWGGRCSLRQELQLLQGACLDLTEAANRSLQPSPFTLLPITVNGKWCCLLFICWVAVARIRCTTFLELSCRGIIFCREQWTDSQFSQLDSAEVTNKPVFSQHAAFENAFLLTSLLGIQEKEGAANRLGSLWSASIQ